MIRDEMDAINRPCCERWSHLPNGYFDGQEVYRGRFAVIVVVAIVALVFLLFNR